MKENTSNANSLTKTVDIQSVFEQENQIDGTSKNKELFVNASTLLARCIEDIPCLLYPIFPKVGLIALAGSSDTGKSSLLRQFAISIAAKKETFIGFRVQAEHNRVLYISTEDDETATAYLLTKANHKMQINREDYDGLIYLFEVTDPAKQIREYLDKHSCDAIIIDAFTDVYGGSMNESNKVRVFLNQFSQIAQHYQCLVIFLHHSGKRTEQNLPSKHNLLGSQGFEAKMRFVAELRLDNMNLDLRHLCIVKANYLGRQHKNESYVLRMDENQTFDFTGDRIDFEELRENPNKSLVETAKEMHKNGKTQSEISKELNKDQSTISRWLSGKI